MLGGEGLLQGPDADDVPLGQEQGVGAQAPHRGQVVVDDHNGLPVLPQGVQHAGDGPLRGDVHPGEGLVHEVDVGLLGEGARHEGALLLPPGELGDLPPGQVGDASRLQGRLDDGALGRPGTTPPPQVPVGAHGDHVAHRSGEVPVDLRGLGHVGHTAAGTGKILPEESHPPCQGGDEPHHGLQEGGLPGAVGPQDRHDRTGRHVEGDVPEGQAVVVGHAQAGHLAGGSDVVHGSARGTRVAHRRHFVARAATMVSAL